jgi:hypothetical protein
MEKVINNQDGDWKGEELDSLFRGLDTSKISKPFDKYLTVKDILELRRGENSYNSSEVEILARLETEEIYELFLSFEEEELTDYIRVFMLLAGSSEALATKVNEALDKIANISKLNTYRMAKFRN